MGSDSQYTHAVTCSGDRRFPPGTKGVSCSCGPRDSQKADRHPFLLGDATEFGTALCLVCGMVAHHRLHAPESEPAPESAEPKLWRCRLCGYGVLAEDLERHKTHGRHTDALGRDNQPNNGVAYCINCLDETLRSEPAQREEPDPLLRLAGEWLLQDGLRRFDKTHDVRDSLRRLLERIVRETAQLAGEGGVAGALRRWSLSPESAPEKR